MSFIDLHRAAQRDLGEAADHIRQNSPRSALRFLQAARATMERLAAIPEMGGQYESDNIELAGMRVFPVSRFRNYLIFYQPTALGIEVIRVLHGARDIDRILSMASLPETEDEETPNDLDTDPGAA